VALRPLVQFNVVILIYSVNVTYLLKSTEKDVLMELAQLEHSFSSRT